jgi:uroporphyrinogen-III synthase
MGVLAGKRIVVTRAAHQAEELARPLRELGAQVILLPVLSIVPPEDLEPLQTAAAQIDSYDWIVFSSANAVAALAGQLKLDQPVPKARIAAVGAATREAVQKIGWRVDVVPDRFVAESLVDVMSQHQLKGCRVLIPAAAVTRDVISRALLNLGAHVTVVEAYRNAAPEGIAGQARALFAGSACPDWVTFTSSSAVDHLVEVVGTAAFTSVRIASIGPITSSTVREHGLEVDAEPIEHTIEALVSSIAEAS